MGLLGRKEIRIFAVAAVLSGSIPLCVQAEGTFALKDEKPELGEYYLLLPAEKEIYEVAAGDSLWNISEQLWGDGRRYMDLYEANREQITDPDLIWPGQILTVNRSWHLEKQSGPIGIKWESVYQFDTPRGCSVGMLYGQETGANCTLSGGGEGYNIACLIREKENVMEGPEDYRIWEKAVSDYAEKEYAETVRDLVFEHYLTEDGRNVCLYSYVYTIDLSKYDAVGSIEVEVSAGFTQSDHMQADFVGFSTEGEIRDKVRYVTASFEELLPEGKACNVNDENMQIYPAVDWGPVSYNAIAWIDSYFDDKLKEITGYREKEKSSKETLLDQMKEGKGVNGGKKKAGN